MKKQLIIEHALELFSEQGIEATSVQQITEKCGISKGAFYLSFKSKDELIYSLIDQFVMEFTKEIEHLVNSNIPSEQILRAYIDLNLGSFVKNRSFAKLFIKDHAFIFNKDFVSRLQGYQKILTKLTFAIVEKKYPNLAEHMKHDLVYFILALTKSYSETILLSADKINLELMCSSLEEKVELIAKHATIPFTENTFELCTELQPFNKQALIDYFENFKHASNDLIIVESITLLLKHLNGETLPVAVEKGLLHNLKNCFETKHLVYLYNVGQQL